MKGLFLGRDCVLCGAPLDQKTAANVLLCPSCKARTRQELRCTYGKAVRGCTATDAALFYEDVVRRALIGVKFRGRPAALKWFAEVTADRLCMHLHDWQPEVLVYVPMSGLRRRLRGFDQSEYLASHCAERTGIPCVRALGRHWYARRQSSLPAKERLRNAERGFFVRPEAAARIAGKRVVLIDDIQTTGSTAAVCAARLRSLGAREVYLLAATRVP